MGIYWVGFHRATHSDIALLLHVSSNGDDRAEETATNTGGPDQRGSQSRTSTTRQAPDRAFRPEFSRGAWEWEGRGGRGRGGEEAD